MVRIILPVITWVVAVVNLSAQETTTAMPLGLGMAAPDIYGTSAIYFYGAPTTGKAIREHAPMDSLTFRHTETGLEVATAPPWFAPAHLKPDYDVLWMRAVSMQPDFLEVVVNEHTGQTAYIDRQNTRLRFWPEFLLTIHSIEPKDPAANPVRVKPLDYAGLVQASYAFLKPWKVSDEWAYVELLSNDMQSLGMGWIRWRRDGKLLVDYSLFS